jgi:hypothetical protein
MVAVLALSISATIRHFARGDGPDVRLGLGVTSMCALYVFLILWSGWWWAYRFSMGGWRSRVGFALACGAAGQILFLAGGVILFGIPSSGRGRFGVSAGDALDLLSGWLGMSLYTFLHGSLVRWRLQRRVRMAPS